MKSLIIALLLSIAAFGQSLTKSDIETVLKLQGVYGQELIEHQTDLIYERYLDQHSELVDGLAAFGLSTLSGVSLGFHESFTFGYKNSGWIPGFMKDWYLYRPNTDAVFGKALSWQKIWRDVDYAADRAGWNKWKAVWRVEKFLSWNTLGAFATHFTVKNTFATMVRDRFKHDRFFYSFQFDLIFGEQLLELFNQF